ncbi:MAG: hypothetical protein BMS9Abin07_0382 [Acidimicrobiia bacterium]|nr:MAG: hypothetical protein BMS9Abin07_0382 [Acidimicrobiia bacterium]
MSGSSDYQGEMFTSTSISDADAEALLAGTDGVRSDLGDLANVLGSIKTAGQAFVHMDISRLARTAALEARAVPAARLNAAQTAARSEWMARMAPRVAVGALALIMLVVSSTGLAFAADGAKPGDLLYGLDRAAEALGIGNGGADERIAEAHALVASGAISSGLTHAAAVLDDTPASETAKETLHAAATRLEAGSPPNADTKAQVTLLLEYIAGQKASGEQVDGAKVSELARMIGGPAATTPGKSDQAPGQDGTPGKSDNTPGQDNDKPGKPDNTPGQDNDKPGKPDNTPGQDNDKPGKPDNTPGQDNDKPGKPDDTPGHDDDKPGESDQAPGHDDDKPGSGRP